jgi:hypothetical protein
MRRNTREISKLRYLDKEIFDFQQEIDHRYRTHDGGGVFTGRFPSYNPDVMGKTILNDISSLDYLLEPLSREIHHDHC